MANDFVKTITTAAGTTYDIQDARLTVTAADAGKVVSVDENGNLMLVGSGTKLYKHHVTFKFITSGGSQLDWEIYYFDTSSIPCGSLDDFNDIRNSPNYIFGHGFNRSSWNEFMLAFDPVTYKLYEYNIIVPNSAIEFECQELTDSNVSDWLDTVTLL